MTLTEVVSLFDKNDIPYCVVGGYAVTLHGHPRMTADIDFLTSLTEKSLSKLESVLKAAGFESRIPATAKEIVRFRKEYIENRNLIAWGFVHRKNPVDMIDILINIDISEVDVEVLKIGGKKINVISLDDLILLKKKAGRPQDAQDLQHLQRIKNEK